jgi:hypothetical protein
MFEREKAVSIVPKEENFVEDSFFESERSNSLYPLSKAQKALINEEKKGKIPKERYFDAPLIPVPRWSTGDYKNSQS